MWPVVVHLPKLHYLQIAFQALNLYFEHFVDGQLNENAENGI